MVRRLAIAFFYDQDGIVDEYMIYLIRELGKFVERTIFVSNGALTRDSESALAGVADDVLIRENEGFDVWAYKTGLEFVGYEALSDYDEILLYNHTFYGPIFPFSEMFSEIEARNCDFWGITAHKRMEPNPFTGDGILPFHLNSHFIAIRRRMVSSPAFQEYWDNLPEINNYKDSILKHESTFVEYFTDRGFKVSVYLDPDVYTSNYALIEEVDAVIGNRCPILKRRSLFDDPIVMDQMAIDLPRALRLIKGTSDYNLDFIWTNILREAELRVLHTNAALMNIFPDARLLNYKRDYGRIAVCIHIYYTDMLEELLGFCRNMPYKFDFIATTDTEEKRNTIEHFVGRSRIAMLNKIIVRVVEKNIGADTSALLITCQDLILGGGYELVCRLHSKRSVQDKGGRGRYFKRHLFENLVGSAGYVANVLDMFFDNPHVGLAIPPAIHVHYSTLGHGWFNNLERTKNVAAHIGINVRFDRDTPVAAFGSMFWFRPAALRKLFAYPWKWGDFEHDQVYGDGDLPHAIERVYAYVAQDAKYLTQTIASLHQAAQNYVRLEYKVQKLASLIPAGDFAYHCYLLTKWKEAGHPFERELVGDALRGDQVKTLSIGHQLKRMWPRQAIAAHIDSFNQCPTENQTGYRVRRKGNQYLMIVGWSVPLKSDKSFTEVVIRLRGNNGEISVAATLMPRPDVARHFNKPGLLHSGFKWTWPMEVFNPGTYTIEITGTDAQGWNHSRCVGELILE